MRVSSVTPTGLSRNFVRLALAALIAALAFGTAIVILSPAPPGLHESAGVVLLTLILADVALARRARSTGALYRSCAALATLVSMGTAGAALGLGVLPPWLGTLPGVLLLVLIGLLAETIRYAWRRPGPAAAPTGRSAGS
jgi:hypothetical protein